LHELQQRSDEGTRRTIKFLRATRLFDDADWIDFHSIVRYSPTTLHVYSRVQ
jgi:hypothetical protein